MAAHYVFEVLVCAFLAGLVSVLADWGVLRWIGLTALLVCPIPALEWRGPFWSVRLQDQGLAMCASVWRQRVRYDDIEFIQAGTLLERFTAAGSLQTLKIETRRGTLKARLPPNAASECAKLLTDRASRAECVDLTGMDLRELTGLSGSLLSGARDTPSHSTGSHARVARYYLSAGASTLGCGVVLMVVLVAGLPAAMLRQRTWSAALGVGSRALFLGLVAGGLISLGRGLRKRSRSTRVAGPRNMGSEPRTSGNPR